ncbi:hypothetical protein Tco_0981685, partial [Tanacetum coccineum]
VSAVGPSFTNDDTSSPVNAAEASNAKEKTVNGERQLQALVDKKKVIITETSIRSDLHLEDAGGIDCLPTATIFEELARMGYEKPSQKLTFYKAFFSPQWKFLIHTITQCLSAKTTAWNEFSSTMASAIICLATNQKFNLSKYIFDAMVKHLEGGVKFLMYPRFVQVFINQQLGDMSHHKKIYVNPSHTKKIFANMKREGKDFSGRVTPLFATMMVQANQEEGGSIKKTTAVPHPSDSTADVPNEESMPTHSNDPLLSGEDRLKLTDLMNMCTKLSERVLDLEHIKTENASNQGRSIKDIDKDVEVSLVDETQGRLDDAEMFDTDALIGNEVFAESDMIEKDQDVIPKEVSTTVVSPPVITEVEITLAQTLAKLKSVKSKHQGKGKAKMDEPKVPLKKKDQIALNEEMARNIEAQIQAELIEEERLARKKEEEANIALIES